MIVPVKPMAGELYIVDCNDLPQKHDALFDRYFWRHNGSKTTQRVPKTHILVNQYITLETKTG